MALPSASRIDLADIFNYEERRRNAEFRMNWRVSVYSFSSILVERIWLANAESGLVQG